MRAIVWGTLYLVSCATIFWIRVGTQTQLVSVGDHTGEIGEVDTFHVRQQRHANEFIRGCKPAEIGTETRRVALNLHKAVLGEFPARHGRDGLAFAISLACR
jgi:hypothetical protein